MSETKIYSQMPFFFLRKSFEQSFSKTAKSSYNLTSVLTYIIYYAV